MRKYIASFLLSLPVLAFSADFSIADFGAKADGSKSTEAFKAAFSAAEKAGGGRVVVPPGKWISGAIHLKSNCELHLSEGAEIVFTQNPRSSSPAPWASSSPSSSWGA
jgi:polygalacturonase